MPKTKVLGKYNSLVMSLPDALTLSRAMAGMAFLGLILLGKSPAIINIALVLLLWGVLSDALDGKIARHLQIKPSFIGKNEISYDMIMAAGYLIYIGATHLAPMIIGVGWGLLTFCAALLPNNNDIYLKPKKLIQIPGFFLMGYLARFLSWQAIVISLVCLTVILAFDWQRAEELRQERQQDFGNWIQEAKKLYKDLSSLEKTGWATITSILAYFYFRLNNDAIAVLTLPLFFTAIYVISSERLIRLSGEQNNNSKTKSV